MPLYFTGASPTGSYSVSLEDVEATVSAFQSFTALPLPKQVWTLIERPAHRYEKGQSTYNKSKGISS
jgi:hypothetical protein